MRNMHHSFPPQQGTSDANWSHIEFARLMASFRQQRGLSQEQLARASCLSRTYVYHLEQAMRTHPSQHVVQRIARALELPAPDRQRLYEAYLQLTGEVIEENHVEQVVPDVRELINAFACSTSYPTHTLDRFWFIPTWNQAALTFFEMHEAGRAEKPIHLLEWLFTSHMQQHLAAWEDVAGRLINDFCYHTRTLQHLPSYKALWKQLQKLPHFRRLARLYSSGQQPAPSLQVRFHHSRFGVLTLRAVTMQVKGSHHDWLISYIPDDQHTWQSYHLSLESQKTRAKSMEGTSFSSPREHAGFGNCSNEPFHS